MLTIDIKKKLPEFRLEAAFRLDHEIMAILGPSGCGKTMTLKCIAGLVKPDEGLITLDDRAWFDSRQHIDLAAQKRRVGFVFQNYALFPHMSVYDNVAFGLRGRPAAEVKEQVNRILAKLGIIKLSNRFPNRLSGGQQQRVALARALAGEPEVLLLDEPFSALDSMVKRRLEDELLRLQDYYPGHILYVTHNLEEAYRLSSRMAIYEAGKVLQQGYRQDIIQRPASRRVAVLTGSRNLFPGVVRSVEDSRVQVEAKELGLLWAECTMNQGLKVNQQVTVGIRPGHIQLGNRESVNSVSMRVDHYVEEVSGYTYRLHASSKPDSLSLEARSVTTGPLLQPGDNCVVYLPPSRLFIINDQIS